MKELFKEFPMTMYAISTAIVVMVAYIVVIDIILFSSIR